jgi:hypothetical protein
MPAYLFIKSKIHDPAQYACEVHVVLSEQLPPPPRRASGTTAQP